MPSADSIDKTSLRFEEFIIDTQHRGLYRGAERIHLPPTPFKVLGFLASQRGSVVSKEELLKAVWGGQRDENTVEQAIRQIRRALGDDKDHPRFIQTLPGVGYCFIGKAGEPEQAAVEPEPSSSSNGAVNCAPAETAPSRMLWGAGLAAVFVAGVLLVLIVQSQSRARLAVTNPVRITESQTLVLSPLLRGEGRIYYPQFVNGRYAVAATPTDGGKRVNIATGLADPELCDLAPDHSAMLLRNLEHSRDDEEPLYIFRKGGKALRVGNVLAYDAAWNPNRLGLLYSANGAVYSSDTAATQRQRLFSVPGNAYWFRWSPDGRRLRFTVIDKRNEGTSLWEIDRGDKRPHRLLQRFDHYVCCGTWTPDGKFFLFQVRVGDRFQIWARNEQHTLSFLDHNQPYPLVAGAESYRGPLVSRNGKKLFLRAENPKGELVRYDAHSREPVPVLPGLSISTAAFTRDGNWIAYSSATDNNLWRCRADGTQCIPLTQNLRRTLVPRWSPNGQLIAFMGVSFPGVWEIFVIPANGGGLHRVFQSRQAEGYPDWAPDGERLVFSEVVPVAQPEGVHIFDLRTNSVTTLPGSHGFYLARWSSDGRFLTALHAGDQYLYLYDFATAVWEPLVKMRAGYPNWSRDNKAIYFLSDVDRVRTVFRVSVANRRVEKIASLDSIVPSPTILGDWMGLAPDDVPLAVENMTTDDVYAWDLSVK